MPRRLGPPLPRELSGALADRIDLSLAVEPPTAQEMAAGRRSSSAAVRERVVAARERQERRLGLGRCNADMTLAELRDATLGDARRGARWPRATPSCGSAAGATTASCASRGRSPTSRARTRSPTSTSLAPSACGAGGAMTAERLAPGPRGGDRLPGAAAGPRRAAAAPARDRRRAAWSSGLEQEHGGDHRRLAARRARTG